MWQVIYCAKGKNKLLSKSRQTLINEGRLGSSSVSRGNSPAKCHLDIWSRYPTQLGQKVCHFRACELAESYSGVQNGKCHILSSICLCIHVFGSGHIWDFKTKHRDRVSKEPGWKKKTKKKLRNEPELWIYLFNHFNWNKSVQKSEVLSAESKWKPRWSDI